MEQLSSEEFLLHQVRQFNKTPGKLKGYDCPECLNRGYIAVARDGRMMTRECTCLRKRELLRKLAGSGIQRLHEFSGFQTVYPWQAEIKQTAEAFCNQSGAWFFIGGQSGCGKTHICTAILNEFLSQGVVGTYLLWREDSVRLKANINEREYETRMQVYKTAELLYIDDLFKTRGNEMPSAGDVNLAFELINARYQRVLPTVISSERTLKQILDVDEAVGSRIFEMAKGFCLNVSKAKDKNWRLHG